MATKMARQVEVADRQGATEGPQGSIRASGHIVAIAYGYAYGTATLAATLTAVLAAVLAAQGRVCERERSSKTAKRSKQRTRQAVAAYKAAHGRLLLPKAALPLVGADSA